VSAISLRGTVLCFDRRYSDKCYLDWNSHRQTRHYALHSHSPGGDSFVCNGIRFLLTVTIRVKVRVRV